MTGYCLQKLSRWRELATMTTVQTAMISSRTAKIRYSETPFASSRPHRPTPAMMPPMAKAIRRAKRFINLSYRQAFRQKFVWFIAGGVGAILFDVALLMLFFSKFPEEEPFESYAISVFLLIVAGAVSFIMYLLINKNSPHWCQDTCVD